jgi:hypothetical protein
MYYSDQTCKGIGSTKMACPDMSLENSLMKFCFEPTTTAFWEMISR